MKYLTKQIFNYPIGLVYRAWHDPLLLSQWWPPSGALAHIMAQQFQNDGQTIIRVTLPDAMEYYEKLHYIEIYNPSKIIYLASTCDREGNNIANPFLTGWPQILLTQCEFVALNPNETQFSLSWLPFQASEGEIELFEKSFKVIDYGWGESLKQLDDVLLKLTTPSDDKVN